VALRGATPFYKKVFLLVSSRFSGTPDRKLEGCRQNYLPANLSRKASKQREQLLFGFPGWKPAFFPRDSLAKGALQRKKDFEKYYLYYNQIEKICQEFLRIFIFPWFLSKGRFLSGHYFDLGTSKSRKRDSLFLFWLGPLVCICFRLSLFVYFLIYTQVKANYQEV